MQGIKTPTQVPLPVIAVSSTDATKIAGPFDIALVPPELLVVDPTMDADTREEIELWGHQSNFEVIQVEDN